DPAAAFERLEQLVAETGRTLVHPFDDPVVIAGQGTVGLEVVEDVPDVDVVLVPCGGGGLVAGVAAAVKALRPKARVVAVEPERSSALHEGLRAGRLVPVTPRSAADALSAPFAGGAALALCRELGVESVLVSERELVEAFRWLYARAKLACELGAAAATAALLAGRVRSSPARRSWRWSPGATWGPSKPLLSWPHDEGRHPPRVRDRDGDVLLREHVPDALDEARAARRDLLAVPPVLHGHAEAGGHRRPRRALPAPARARGPREARLAAAPAWPRSADRRSSRA